MASAKQYINDIVNYTISGVLIPTFSTIGIVGNILCLLVLSNKNMRGSTTNWYLMALAISDTLVLANSILTVTKDTLPYQPDLMRWQVWQQHPWTLNLFVIAHPVAILFQVTSIWLTVAFAMDRYLMICHPFLAQRICSIRRTKLIIVVIFIASTIYNLPRFFENSITEIVNVFSNNDTNSNITLNVQNVFSGISKIYFIDVTSFGNSISFKVYYHLWSWIVLVILIPLSLIIYMNIYLIYEVRKSVRRLQSMNRQLSNYSEEASRNDTNVMLIGVILIFLICQIPVGISHILWALDFHMYVYNEIGNFLIILNSAINILPYYVFSRRFRAGLISLFKSTLFGCRKQLSRSKGTVPQTFVSYRYPGVSSTKVEVERCLNDFKDECPSPVLAND